MTPDYPPAFGGIQEVSYKVVSMWQRVATHVVTLRIPGSRDFDRRHDRPLTRVAVPPLGRRADLAGLNLAAAIVAMRFRPSVVFSVHITTSLAARALQRLGRIPYVQYLHGMEIPARPRLAAFATRGAAAVAVNSRYTERLALAHGARPEHLHIIPPGVDPPSLVSSRSNGHRRTVVVVSRLDERYKGHDVLIRALPLVRARVPEARLVIVGEGVLRIAYERLAEAVGVAKSVEFTGSVERNARDALLARAHVAAMPSRLAANGGGEGFGIAYLEAGAHGLPVVAGNVGGALDAVVDGETGLLVDPWDHVAVADAIAELLLDSARAEQLGRAGRERAKRFTWSRAAGRLEELLIDVANRRAGSLR